MPTPSEITDGVFRSIARMLVAFSRFPDLNKTNIQRWIRYEGFEYFLEAKAARQRSAVCDCAHGRLGIERVCSCAMAEPMHVVVRPLDNPLIDAAVEIAARRPGIP